MAPLGHRWRLRDALALFQTLYSQQDGATPLSSGGGTKLTFNEDLAEKTLAYMQNLTANGLMPNAADYAGAQTFMFTGESGFYFAGRVGDHDRAEHQGTEVRDGARSRALRQAGDAGRLAHLRPAEDGPQPRTR